MSAQPRRVQLSRARGSRLPPGTIVVARPTRWGNPYRVGEGSVTAAGRMAGQRAGFYNRQDRRWYESVLDRGLSADDAVQLYRDDLIGTLSDVDDPARADLLAALAELAGHDLACWCPLDAPCHADVLLHLANPPLRAAAQAAELRKGRHR